jgi:imidazolonepropionase-like amidohydrolase
VRNFKLSLTALIVLSCFCISGLPQNSTPIGIRPEPPEGKGVVALKAGRLIDATGAPPIKNAVVIVTNNRITAVGESSSVRIPAGAKVIDLGDVTLLPGFIDAHTHLIGRVLGDPEGDMSPVRDYESFGAILGVLHARDTYQRPQRRCGRAVR